MAQYKVIQDIEAEDKLLGPLTLKGLIYAIIAGGQGRFLEKHRKIRLNVEQLTNVKRFASL